TVEEIEAIRRAAPSANSPAWKNHFGEMAKKTVFRRLAKMLPLSTEAQNAVGLADAADRGAPAQIAHGHLIEEAAEPEEKKAKPAGGRRSRLDRLADEAATDVEHTDVEDDDATA